jgi:hypothetical protein
MIEWLHVNGYPSLANSEYVESNNSVATNVGDYAGEIRALVDAGWCREDAEACTLLTNDGRPGMARALREGSNVYAASTYTLCDVLTQQARRQEEARQRCGGALPVRLYRNLQGRLGLLADDPNWSVLDREVRRTSCSPPYRARERDTQRGRPTGRRGAWGMCAEARGHCASSACLRQLLRVRAF